MNVLPLAIASAILAQAAAATEPPKSDAASLVARLASDDPPTRDAASSVLRALGPAALPALRAARHGNVPALQPLAAALMKVINQDQLIFPRTIALDYKDEAMRDVIKDLTERTGCRVTIYSAQTDWLATRITLRTPAPVPFWSAVDKVCDAGRFGSNLGLAGGGASVAIFRGYSTGPVSDHGPFRVQLDGISFQGRYRQLHLKPANNEEPGPNLGEDDAGNSFIKAHVNVEPRMLLKNAGKLKNLTAEDDLGQSLIPSDPLGKQDTFEFGFTPAAETLAQIPLAQDKKGSRRIKILRGVAPVAVGGLRPEPIVIPLLGEGKSFQGDDTVVTVRSVAKRPAARALRHRTRRSGRDDRGGQDTAQCEDGRAPDDPADGPEGRSTRPERGAVHGRGRSRPGLDRNPEDNDGKRARSAWNCGGLRPLFLRQEPRTDALAARPEGSRASLSRDDRRAGRCPFRVQGRPSPLRTPASPSCSQGGA